MHNTVHILKDTKLLTLPTEPSKYMKQKPTGMEVEIKDSTAIVGDAPTCNLTLSITDRTIRKKIIKDRENLNNTTNLMLLKSTGLKTSCGIRIYSFFPTYTWN